MLKHPSWIRPFLIGTLAVLMLATCKSGEKEDFPNEPEEASNETVLVGEGESLQPSFSAAGDKLLFISKGRRSHAHAQVYEKDLVSGTERRITFQNGNTSSPRYNPKEGWVIYASSTDELKEDSPLLKSQPSAGKLPYPYTEPFELYIHSFQGLEIVRLTHSPGYDGEARFLPDGSLAWTRVVNGKLQIMTSARGSPQAKPMKGPGKNASQWNTSSDGKHRAWVEWSNDFTVSHIKLQSGTAPPREIAGEVAGFKTDLAFSPDSKFLLWAQVNSRSTKFEIWGFEIATSCARKLVSASGDRRHPAVSPDSKRLVFSSWRKDRSRIAELPFMPAAGPCVAAP